MDLPGAHSVRSRTSRRLAVKTGAAVGFDMDNDTAAIILTVILAVGAAYAALAHKLSSFGERLARIEGIIEGWLTPPPPKS